MASRDELLTSIAETVADYREGDGMSPTPERINRWVKQFDAAVQIPILQEMDHVLKRTYISRKRAEKFLEIVFETEKLVGDDPCAFWKSVKFLDIQDRGNSQKAMLELFGTILEERCKHQIGDDPTVPNTFVYLDDAIFTGNHVRYNFEKWIANEAPKKAAVYIITIAQYTLGQSYANKEIKKAAEKNGKEIDFRWWCGMNLENHQNNITTSDVLWPTEIPDDHWVKAYIATLKYKLLSRPAGSVGKGKIFSSDEGRQLLEQEFLKAGAKIRDKSFSNTADSVRPLGHMSLESLGFGSMIVTFRNCPNNAPLVLWAGDPWVPLFPRITNRETSIQRMFDT